MSKIIKRIIIAVLGLMTVMGLYNLNMKPEEPVVPTVFEYRSSTGAERLIINQTEEVVQGSEAAYGDYISVELTLVQYRNKESGVSCEWQFRGITGVTEESQLLDITKGGPFGEALGPVLDSINESVANLMDVAEIRPKTPQVPAVEWFVTFTDSKGELILSGSPKVKVYGVYLGMQNKTFLEGKVRVPVIRATYIAPIS